MYTITHEKSSRERKDIHTKKKILVKKDQQKINQCAIK